MKGIYIILTAAMLTACASSQQRTPASPDAVTLDPNSLDTAFGEFLVPGEQEATQKLLTLFKAHMKLNYADTGKEARRAVHAKDHGCLRDVKFEVFDQIEPALKFGVFREPKIYDAFIRLSNGDGPPGKDTDKLISIGFAIKLLNVHLAKLLPTQENAQDFLMINQPAFLVPDVVQFAELIKARESGVLDKGLFAVTHPDAVLYRSGASPKDDPLNTFYWSALPFRLGNTTVKYLMRPCQVKPKTTGSNPDFLTNLVKAHIEHEDACFNFYLQKRLINGNENVEMPIENARTIWSEDDSKPVLVAQVRIPRQAMLDNEKQKTCEQAEYSPWTSTADFRPLGNLNRIRRSVYDFSSGERHRINQSADPFTE